MVKKPELPDEQEALRLVEQHLDLVEVIAKSLCKQFRGKAELDDLLQEGALGLIDAASRFNPDRKIKFETYAVRRIRGAMLDALRKSSWPRDIRKLRREITKAQEAASAAGGQSISMDQIAQAIGKSLKNPRRSMARLQTVEAMSPFPSQPPNHAALPQWLVSQPLRTPEQVLLASEERRRFLGFIFSLPRGRRRVILLCVYHELRQREAAPLLGVGETRVSQFFKEALALLGKSLASSRRQGRPTSAAKLTRKQIGLALKRHNYAVADAAADLGVDDATLAKLVLKFGINFPLAGV